MVVSKLLVWVRLHNLQLHFWHHKVLTGIGNSLGKFLEIDADRVTKGIFTFARIYVDVDLSKGLPDHILLLHNNQQWSQSLDYENTTFRCRTCLHTGHLQSACPQLKKDRKKCQPQKPKGWQFTRTQEAETEGAQTTDNTTNINVQKKLRKLHRKMRLSIIHISSIALQITTTD